MNNYLDIILESMCAYGGDFAEIRTVTNGGADEVIPISPANTSAPETDGAAQMADSQALARMLRERMDFAYPAAHLKNIPSKLTVSRLYPEILDEFDDGAADLDSVPKDLPEPAVPRFLAGSVYSPADAGSAAHLFLQFCDFEKLSSLGVGAELCRLTEAGFLSRAEGEAANLDYIEKFRHSEFFRRILDARSVHREFRFNVAIPAYTLTGDEEKRRRLLADGTDVVAQGVIDIVFTDIDGKLVLADYKTDRLTEYELSHKRAAADKLWRRYKNQLFYYSLACEKLFGRKPDEVLIYSMPLGETLWEN